MTNRSPASPLFLMVACGWLALALPAAGCKQSEGDRCETASDCSSGLTCAGVMNGNGICVPPNIVGVSGTGGATGGTGGTGGGTDGAVDAPADTAAAPDGTTDIGLDAPPVPPTDGPDDGTSSFEVGAE